MTRCTDTAPMECQSIVGITYFHAFSVATAYENSKRLCNDPRLPREDQQKLFPE